MSIRRTLFFASLLPLMHLSSCVTTLNSEKVIGVKPDAVVKTVERSKLVSCDISGWDSTWDVWFGSSHDKVELKPLDEWNGYGVDIGRIPIGHEVKILKVKRYSWNHTVKVIAEVEKGENVHRVIMGAHNARRIFGLSE